MQFLAVLQLLLISLAAAERVILGTALLPCMENNAFTVSRFDVSFTPENRTLAFDVSMNIAIQGQVYAEIALYAYGFKVISKTVDPCNGNSLKQLCPLYAGEIDIQSTTTVGEDVINDIPGVAFTVPDIDAIAIVKVYSIDDADAANPLACIRAELSNAKSVEQTAVKWVTAIISGLGILISALFLYFGNVGISQHIAAVAGLMFQYFQSQALVNMQGIERVPPIASAWSENLSWSLGLIYSKSLEAAYRWYVQSTGGTPDTYHLYQTKSVLTQKVKRSVGTLFNSLLGIDSVRDAVKNIPPRVADVAEFFSSGHAVSKLQNSVMSTLSKRENELAKEFYAEESETLVVFRGIERVGYDMGLETTSIVLAAFVVFMFMLLFVAALFALIWLGFFVLRRVSKNFYRHQHASNFYPYIRDVFKGNMLRIVFMGFAPVLTFAFWEFIKRDSAAVIVIACFLLVSVLVVMGLNLWRIHIMARKSIAESGTAAYLLYSEPAIRHRVGFMYFPYHAGYYWFLMVYFGSTIIKCIMIGFVQSSGKASSFVIWIVELVTLGLICWKRPYLDKATNVINVAMQVIITLNALFYVFFSNLFTQPLAVNAVMGVIYFVMNAAFSLILLLYTLIYGILCVVRRNPDAHLAPTKDDRMSFIDEKAPTPDAAGELTALGAAAQADHDGDVAQESHHWFNAGDPGLPRNPFSERTLRHNSSFDRLSSPGLSRPQSFNTEIPDVSTVDAHMSGGHQRNSSTADIMSNLSRYNYSESISKKK